MPRGPQPMSTVLAELMARRGFARIRSMTALEAAWAEAAGEFIARHSRVAAVRRGKLEILVASSTLAQELTFRKPSLLDSLRNSLPDETIGDLRFRVGPVQ